MKKYILSALILMAMGLQTMWAQKVLIYKTDSQTVEYEISELDSIVFVPKEQMQSYLTCPDDNHPHAIDLGLPSGTKWCCCNVGSNNPKNGGGYYAWGEISEKDVYTETNYSFYAGQDTNEDGDIDENFSVINIGLENIAGTPYDVAHVSMGTPWQMPTNAQLWELRDKCEIISITGCFKIIRPNGGYIFMPQTGFKIGSANNTMGGAYWSCELNGSNNSSANCWGYGGFYFMWKHGNRFCGNAVRAVCP